MSDGGDCRTAPATPGLLITELHGERKFIEQLFRNSEKQHV